MPMVIPDNLKNLRGAVFPDDAILVLMRPDGRAAILLTGAYPTNEPCSVAFEVNLQNIQVLRDDLAKAEAFLSQKSGNA